MPFVRISLLKSNTTPDKKKLSEAVHSALMNSFNVPTDDYFHLIEEMDEENFLYSKSYAGIDHSPNLVFVYITAASGRSYEQKEKLYTEIAQNIEASTIVRKNDVIIILNENGGSQNWSFGNGEIQEFHHIKGH